MAFNHGKLIVGGITKKEAEPRKKNPNTKSIAEIRALRKKQATPKKVVSTVNNDSVVKMKKPKQVEAVVVNGKTIEKASPYLLDMITDENE